MKPKCSTCNDLRLVIVRQFDSSSRIGFQQFAKPCPVCRPHLNPKPVFDGKMAAAGGDR